MPKGSTDRLHGLFNVNLILLPLIVGTIPSESGRMGVSPIANSPPHASISISASPKKSKYATLTSVAGLPITVVV